jgi:hypothetical protein
MMMKLARFVLLTLAISLGSAGAMANPFRVGGVAVDVSGGTPSEAVSKGRAQARVEAARRLIERLTLAEDRARAGGIDVNEVARLYTSVDIEGTEKRTATRYIAVLAVNFDAEAVRDLLDAKRVPFVESQAARALVIPAASALTDADRFRAAFSPASDASALTPYQVGGPALIGAAQWDALAAERAAAGARRVIVAELGGAEGAWIASVTELTSDGGRQSLGSAGPLATQVDLGAAVIGVMETAWKNASVVRTAGSTELSVIARFSSLAEWVRIRSAIEKSRLVASLDVEAVTVSGADLRFVFSGRPDQLASDLAARGVALVQEGQTWLLRVTGAG